jgi:DNA-directed RNA polymerase specialized sigma24 family protein
MKRSAEMDLSSLSVEELEAKAQGLMAERAEAEAPFKEQLKAIGDELGRRATLARVEAALDGLSDDQRIAVLTAAGKGS